jgi:hypothetical protein
MLLYLLGFAALVNLLPSGDVDPVTGLLGSIQFVFGLIYVAAVLSYGFECRLEATQSGFPARLFTLPVRTSMLVGWPMLQGVTAVTLLWLAWSCLALRPSGVEVSLGFTALVAGAFVAVLQALLWSPFRLPWLRVIVALLVLPLLVLVPWFARTFAGLSDRTLLIVFAALIPLAYLAALVGVSRARHGDTPLWQGVLRRQVAGSPSPRPPFATAARAQLWFEWRSHGLTFPLLVGGLLALQLAWSLHVERWSLGKLPMAIPLPFAALLLAPFLGCFLGKSGTAAANNLPLSSFTAARPVGCGELVAAKVKVAALNSLAAWTLVLLAVSFWVLHSAGSGELSAVWSALVLRCQSWRAGGLVVLGALALLLLIWKLQVDSFFLGLAGRRWLFAGGLVVYACAFTSALLLLAKWAVQQDFFDPFLHNAGGWVGGAVALKLLAAGVLVRSLLRRRLVGKLILARLLAGWLLAAVVLSAFAAVVLPAGSVSLPLVAGVVVLCLPLTRLAAAPLALAWNRHR